MKPIFSREAIVDRRQPYIRWHAVLAGSLLALGLWNLLQLLFVGGALMAIDRDEVDHVRAFGIGTGAGSMIAPLIAMFLGGMLAGRLAAHFDRRVSGLHGVLVWALTSAIGLVIMANVIDALVNRTAAARVDVRPAATTRAYLEDRIEAINHHLKSQNAPTISLDEFVDASRYAMTDRDAVNRDAFASRLDAKTKLSRPEADAVLAKLGDDAPEVITAGHEVAVYREQALGAAEDTGNALLIAGIGLLLCAGTAIAGAVFGARRLPHRPEAVPHTTAPYPVTVASDPDVRRDPTE